MTPRKSKPKALTPRVRRAQQQTPLPVGAVDPPQRSQTPTERAADIQFLVATSLKELGETYNIPPGLMVLALLEFLALMIRANFPQIEDARAEAHRLADHLHARTIELQSGLPPGSL